jgi:tRNA G10  N-methylase Trm11
MATTPSASLTTYAAFLGNHPSLSIAELRSSIPDLKVVRRIGMTVVLFSTSKELTNADLRAWGGIFLMARAVQGQHSMENIPRILREETQNVKGKVTFSIRAHGVSFHAIHRLYRDGKQAFKSAGIPVRYIGNERKPPVSVQLHDEGLITGKEGAEIVILADEESNFVWIGRTIAAQDPDAYTKRDMHKPVRDTRAGLLPPKLAQMLLNYGDWIAREINPALKKTITVFDPFCGTGVIPMEALLRKWPVLASDASLKAVNGCEKNLDWIRKEHEILKRDVPSTIWKQDATKPFELKEKPDVIVTETMLGPALGDRPTAKDAAKYRSDCDTLEIAFLENVAKTLPGVPVVAAFPVWYIKTGPVFLEQTWKKLEKIGFKAVFPQGTVSDIPDHTSLLYRRTDQFVGREIVILKPLK